MSNKELNEHWNISELPYIKELAKLLNIEYTENIDRLVCGAYSDGFNHAYNVLTKELVGKNTLEIMHHLMLDTIIDEVNKKGGTVRLKGDGYFVRGVAVDVSPTGMYIKSGCIMEISTENGGITFEVPDVGFVMQNELSFIDLLHIYKLIP